VLGEVFAVNNEALHRSDGSDGGGTRLVADEGALAKECALAERR
jgi:hypothetical protein